MNDNGICNEFDVPKPACNLGPLSFKQQTSIKMTFYWRADDGLLLISDIPETMKFQEEMINQLHDEQRNNLRV